MEAPLLMQVTVEGSSGLAMDVIVPDGWWVGDADGAEAVLMRAEHGAFRTNVVLSCDRVAEAVDLAQIAQHTRVHLDARYGAIDVRGERARRAGEADGFVRVALFDVGPTATRTAQVHAVFDAGVVDDRRIVFQVVASCAAEELAALAPEIVAIVNGACVRRSPPGE